MGDVILTILYKEGTTDYSNIGLGSLNGLLNGNVTQARNGQYDMTFSYPRNGLLASELKPGAIVVSDSGHDAINQQFDIQTVTRKTGNSLEVYATHVSYRQILTSLKPSVKVTGSAQVALNAWKDGHVEKFNGAVVSDILTSQTIDWTVGNVTNAREALGGVAGSLLDVFGGEFVFDNENVQLASGAGRNTGVTIAYGKNLTSLEQQESIESTWTSIYPYAKKMNTSTDETGASEEVTITLPEYYLDSENTSKFSKRRIQTVDFSSDDTVKDVVSLRTRASAYMKSNNFGIPKVSIKTSFLDLSKTVEMSQYPQFERVSLCDTVRVYFEEMGIDTKAKVIETVWNMVTDTYDSLTLGESVSNMTTQFDQQDKNNNEILDALNTVQDAANGFNKIFRGPDTPVAKNVGDLWYEPDGEFWNEYMWNGSIWELIASTRKTSEISDAVDEAQKDADQAKEDAQSAVNKANDAVKNAGFANKTAEEAKTSAATAGEEAIKAGKDAKTALDNFENMDLGSRNYLHNANFNEGLMGWATWGAEVAGNTRGIVDVADFPNVFKGIHLVKTAGLGPAYGYADHEVKVLPNKEYTATYFYKTKSKTKIILDMAHPKIKDQIKEVETDGSDTWQRVVFTFTNGNTNLINFYMGIVGAGDIIMTAPQLETGNKESDFKPNPEDLQIAVTNIDGELASKVSQTAFDTLNKTVTTQGTAITQNKKDILVKANQTDVNTLTGRVTTAEGKLIVQAGQISQTVSKNELTNTLGSYATQTWTQGQIKTTADNIQLSVSKVQTNLDNLEVGGRNLVTNTGQFTGNVHLITEKYRGNAVIHANATGNLDLWLQYTTIIPTSSTYTVSFYARSDKEGTTMYNHFYSPNTTISATTSQGKTNNKVDGLIDITLSKKWTRYWIKWTQTAADNIKKIIIGRINVGASVYLNSIMFSDGNLPLDWTAAPEDNASQTDFAAIEIKVNGIQSAVSNKADKSQVTQLANQITSIVTDTNGIKSQITQLKDDINLRVQKGDVINQINISPEGILIDGKKTHITGKTTIDAAVIKDAMIANIKADKITAGTINAANVNLINLNANNIASGTISGINISGVTFRGTDMHLENGLTIGTNGGIFSDFDYGETIGQAFDPRWWKGDVKFTKNYLGYYAQEYVGAVGGKPGAYLGSVQTYIGPNYFKIRKYTNNTNSDMIGRVDMKAEYIQIATGASKQANGVMIYAGGDIDASGTINASQGMYAGRFRLGTKGHTFGTNDDGEVYFLKKNESPLGIHAAAFHQGSLRSIKKNFEATQSKDSLELLDGMNIQKWNYKGESDLKKKHIGLVIDDSTEVRSLKNKLETPSPVLSDDNKSVDLNNFVGLLVSAVQELSKEVKKLKKMEEVNTNEN